MKKLALALLSLWLGSAAQAQTNFNMPPPAGVAIVGLQVVATCGVGTLATTTPGFMVMNQLGQLCTNASGGGGGAITIASGAVASGAYSAGSIGAGAQVDLLTMRGTKVPGTAAANSLLGGCLYTAAGVTLTDGQQAAIGCTSTNEIRVAGIGVAIGSTTSGQTGSLVMGATTTAAPTYTTAQTNPISLTTAGDIRTVFSNTTIAVTNAGTFATQVSSLPATPAGTNTIGTVGQLTYPVGATPITASATGTTGATTATLAGTSGKTTYICGYSIRANATANTNVTNTITGVITATLSSIMWIPANTAGLGVDEQIFSPCIPASATNTGIAIVSGAPGTGGLVSSKGWGYQL